FWQRADASRHRRLATLAPPARYRSLGRSELWALLPRLHPADESHARSPGYSPCRSDKGRRLLGHPSGACRQGLVLEAPWWQRAPLAAFRTLPVGPAVYLVYERDATEPQYIGETSSLKDRATDHAARFRFLAFPMLAFLPMPASTPKHVLRELESDLL